MKQLIPILLIALALNLISCSKESKLQPTLNQTHESQVIAEREASNADDSATGQGSFPTPSLPNQGGIIEQETPTKESWAWLETNGSPYSTASIDVDTASYTLFRGCANRGGGINPEAIRIEDFLNYFPYAYAAPSDDKIIKVHQELVDSPYTKGALLLRVGLKAKELENPIAGKNLVFLVDVSGSMADEDKLPLVKASLKTLTNSLTEKDSISLVTYANGAAVVLPATQGSEKAVIKSAIDKLGAGGGTNGASGIAQAYGIAAKQFISGGVNRVILTTDGDFNIGVRGTDELVKLMKEKSDLSIFLTIMGFGLVANDNLMENVAKDGNGNYFFIDSINEIEKVVNKDLKANLETLAKDVKVQLEFNPRLVKSYRMVGYVNRQLADKDFNDDKKDAGDLGSGQSVTYLYEIQLRAAGESAQLAYTKGEGIDPLTYQDANVLSAAAAKNELGTLKIRFKNPEGLVSAKFDEALSPLVATKVSPDTAFQVAVAGAALKLKGIEIAASTALIKDQLKQTVGEDDLRKEFLSLIEIHLK
ncbi:MAG: VWA domain-containing protein [Proteobacteria bacterium]|nr:MAG: VWA domain-containing protein [Pseudomonadota bacterium]